MQMSATLRRPQHDREAFTRKARHQTRPGTAGSRKKVKVENARMVRRGVRRALRRDLDAV